VNKKLAGRACFTLFLAVLLYSMAFILVSVEHECDGEECLACLLVEHCQAVLRQCRHIGACVFGPAPDAGTVMSAVCLILSFFSFTLISFKVKMNT
jgi:hypothetical protein